MTYAGSKNKLGPDLYKVISDHSGLPHQSKPNYWVEPFVGMAGMLQHVPPHWHRFGYDNNRDIIALLDFCITAGPEYMPMTLNHKLSQYLNMSNSDLQVIWQNEKDELGNLPRQLRAIFGCWLSINGDYFHSFRTQEASDKLKQVIPHLVKKTKKLMPEEQSATWFYALDYWQGGINCLPENRTIIYCDPPYTGKKLEYCKGFDHEKFYQWCRKLAQQGYKIYISEMTMPPDFQCIWEKQITQNSNKKRQPERLFIPKTS